MRTYFDNRPSFAKPKIEGTLFWLRYPCLAEVKIDGELTYFDGYRLINTYGRAREDLPITKELKGTKAILMGELYYNGGTSFYDEMLINKKSDDLKLSVFDIIEYKGKEIMSLPLSERREILKKIMPKGEHISLAESKVINSEQEVKDYFKEIVAKGYEGIVVKNFHSPLVNGLCHNWIKLKREETLDLIVLGVKKDKSALAIGYLPREVVGAVGNANGTLLNIIAEVKQKGKVIAEDKEYYYTQPDRVIEVKHNGWIRGKTLRSPIFVRERKDKEVKDVKR